MIEATQRLAFWKLVVVALCLCVFVFATNARLVQCEALPTSMAFVHAGQFWPSDHRMEIQSIVDFTALSLLAIVWLFGFCLEECRFPVRSFDFQPMRPEAYWQLRRFFRPPPIRGSFFFRTHSSIFRP